MNDTTGEPRVLTRGDMIPPPEDAAPLPRPQQANGNGTAAPQAAPPPPPPQAAAPQPQPAVAQPTEPEKKTEPEGPWIGKLPLRKKVQAHGEWVEVLTFREPTGGDIAECGVPIYIAQGVLKIDPVPMEAMLARLAVVTPSTIQKLHPNDWTSAAYLIAHFFMPDR